MSRLRILLAAVLCVSMLAFVGCGNNDTTNDNTGDGTVTEESTDMNNDNMNNNNDNGSMMDDLENGAEDAVDDLERDANDAADGMRNAVDGKNIDGRTNYSENSNTRQ